MFGAFERDAERADVISRLAQLPTRQRAALIEDYRRRSEAAFAPETLRCLKQIIRSFSDWCVVNGFSGDPPVEPTVVAAYVESMGGKLSANTIETRLWGIAEHHRSQFQPSPCRHRLVELALKAVKRKYGARTHQAPPITKQDVYEAISKLGACGVDLRDRALILAASDSWCRVSELVRLRVKDLERMDDGSSLLFIARSKTDQFGEGDYAYLSPVGSEAVITWIEYAQLKDNDPIFTKSQGGAKRTPLNPATVSRIFKKRFGRSDVSAHSTRVGGVHDALRLGCSLSAIMVAGRWRSPEMPARYGRRIQASQSAAAEVAKAFQQNEKTTSDFS